MKILANIVYRHILLANVYLKYKAAWISALKLY